VCATTCVYESVSCFFEVCEICVCMCVAEVPALWFKKGRCGQMKFASNEAQIACPSILTVRCEYRIHGPHLLLEIAGTLALFLTFQLHPFRFSNNLISLLFIFIIPLLLFSNFIIHSIFLFSYVSSYFKSHDIFSVYSTFVLLNHVNIKYTYK